jgi:polar amino acid transport system substrate-binding protein
MTSSQWSWTWRLAFSLLLSCALMAERAGAEEALRISADDGAPLFQDVSQILQAAYGRLGLKMEIVRRPGRRSVIEADAGLFDGELVRAPIIESDFHNLIRVPVPVATIDIVAFVGDDKIVVHHRADLANLRVGYERGLLLIEKDPDAKGYFPGNNLDTLLKLLAEGKLDVVLDVPRDVEAAKQRLQLPQLQATDLVFASSPMFHYLHKSHQALVDPLANAIQQERLLRGLR